MNCPNCNEEVREVHRYGPWFDPAYPPRDGEYRFNMASNAWISIILACNCNRAVADIDTKLLELWGDDPEPQIQTELVPYIEAMTQNAEEITAQIISRRFAK